MLEGRIQQKSADLIDGASALTDQSLASLDCTCFPVDDAPRFPRMNTKPTAQERISGDVPESTDRPLITVVYPLFDIRGSAVDALRTWTQTQTLSRALYRVHVMFSEECGPVPHALLAVLADGDRLIHVPDGNDAAMWNAGAAQATTSWLVLVEGHSMADPRCLEHTAAWISAGCGVVGNFAVFHNDDHLMARLAERWFAQIQSIWRSAEGWPHVYRTGFAIRADVFSRAGGFASECGQFAPALLSARINASGVQIGCISGAAVLHLDDAMVADHHHDTADYAAGEIARRSHEEQVFFERYFGHSDLWSNRLCRAPYMRRLWCALLWRQAYRTRAIYSRSAPLLLDLRRTGCKRHQQGVFSSTRS
jgi:Glycosyltransferase like family 2